MVKNIFAERPRNKDARSIVKQKIAARLGEFMGLAENWDGDGADAVSAAAMSLAQKVADQLIDLGVKIEFCVPMRNGGVQFEFRLKEECEIEVHPNGGLFFLSFDSSANLIDKAKITIEQLKNHVK